MKWGDVGTGVYIAEASIFCPQYAALWKLQTLVQMLIASLKSHQPAEGNIIKIQDKVH